MSLRLLTWNVNSVRRRMELLARLTEISRPDVVCLQETKVDNPQFPHAPIREMGFEHIAIEGGKSYAGVAILSRLPLSDVRVHDRCGKNDKRHISAVVKADGALGDVEVHSIYVPAGGDEPDPAWNDKFAHKLEFLAEMTEWSAERAWRRTVLAGDFNIAPLETDVWSHKQLLRVVSHTPVEVDGLNGWRQAGPWVDAVRHIIPESERVYTWWSYRNRDWRASNRGRRLDHVWVSEDLTDHLLGATVIEETRDWDTPSDHAPILININD